MSTLDRVTEVYQQVLTGCIVEHQVKPEDRTAFMQEWRARLALKNAPGSNDQKKPDGGLGDYRIWKTVLAEGERRKKPCLLVTVEKKDDWWTKVGPEPFRVRPDLAAEYARVAAGAALYVLPLSRLVALLDGPTETVSKLEIIESETKSGVAANDLRLAPGNDIMSLQNNIYQTRRGLGFLTRDLERARLTKLDANYRLQNARSDGELEEARRYHEDALQAYQRAENEADLARQQIAIYEARLAALDIDQ